MQWEIIVVNFLLKWYRCTFRANIICRTLWVLKSVLVLVEAEWPQGPCCACSWMFSTEDCLCGVLQELPVLYGFPLGFLVSSYFPKTYSYVVWLFEDVLALTRVTFATFTFAVHTTPDFPSRNQVLVSKCLRVSSQTRRLSEPMTPTDTHVCFLIKSYQSSCILPLITLLLCDPFLGVNKQRQPRVSMVNAVWISNYKRCCPCCLC